MLLDCVIHCACYSVLFRGAVFSGHGVLCQQYWNSNNMLAQKVNNLWNLWCAQTHRQTDRHTSSKNITSAIHLAEIIIRHSNSNNTTDTCTNIRLASPKKYGQLTLNVNLYNMIVGTISIAGSAAVVDIVGLLNVPDCELCVVVDDVVPAYWHRAHHPGPCQWR